MKRRFVEEKERQAREEARGFKGSVPMKVSGQAERTFSGWRVKVVASGTGVPRRVQSWEQRSEVVRVRFQTEGRERLGVAVVVRVRRSRRCILSGWKWLVKMRQTD